MKDTEKKKPIIYLKLKLATETRKARKRKTQQLFKAKICYRNTKGTEKKNQKFI